jgi:hypothetical protein
MMANSMVTGPMAGLTGGLIPALCPPAPTANQLQQMSQIPGGAQAAAGQIQASEANAKARVAAVEYLGTVDCTRWPEAQKALLYALRQDPNECVRFAAARAFNSGCCCHKTVIEALRVCVSGENTDGFPAENSSRVRAAAFAALQNCLMKVPEEAPKEVPPPPPETTRPPTTPPPPPPERTTMNGTEVTHIATGYSPAAALRKLDPVERLQRKTFVQTVDDARRTLFESARNPRQPVTLSTGKRSVFGALAKARHDASASAVQHAREQGHPQPAAPRVDANVQPSSFAPARNSGEADPMVMPASGQGTAPVGDDNGQVWNTAPTSASSAHRGLIGMLFQPRNRQSEP